MTTTPPPLPKLPKPASQWKQLPLAGKITLIVAGYIFAVFTFVQIRTPTTTTSSDPCEWTQRPSGMTHEACERMKAAQLRLRQEYEPKDFKPYSTR